MPNPIARTARFTVVVAALLAGAAANAVAQDPALPDPVLPYLPMTDQERWHQYVVDNFLSAGAYLRAFGTSIGDSNADRPVGWSDGSRRYVRNLASEFGRFTIQGTVQATMAKVLAYDTRYRRCDCTGAWRRTSHALARSFVTHDQAGHHVVDLPRVSGIYAGSFAMMSWYPSGYHLAPDGFRIGTISLAVETGLYVIREFGPDLKRLVRRTDRKRDH